VTERLAESGDDLPPKPQLSRLKSLPEKNEDLLDGFTLESLFDSSHHASLEISSDDPEWRGNTEDPLPLSLQGLSEGRGIWDLIRTPSTDLNQIRQRQKLIDSLRNRSDLEGLIGIKQESYLVFEGIQTLFSLVSVSKNHQEPALVAYRKNPSQVKSNIRDTVFAGFAQIQKGKEALHQLEGTLSTSEDPFLRCLGTEFQRLSLKLASLTLDYFLNPKSDTRSIRTFSMMRGQESHQQVNRFGVMAEFSGLSLKERHHPAEFDSRRPRGYHKGWTFLRSHGNQIENDSPEEHELTIYNGCHKGGKSFSGLKKEFYMQCLAQSFGFVPAENANFPVLHDSFHILDRPKTDHQHNLSALGSDVAQHNRLVETLGQHPFVCMDESWSTTSPKDAFRLGRATFLFLMGRKAQIFAANNNDHILKWATALKSTGVYHFKVDVDDAGKPHYLHQLTQGIDDPKALEVARVFGLPDQPLERAQAFLRGETIPIQQILRPEPLSIEAYPDTERELLKDQRHLVLTNGSPLLRVFSADHDFKRGYPFLMDFPMENQFSGGLRYGGWHPENVTDRINFAHHIITHPLLTSQETLERQRTFHLLATHDRYDELHALEEKMLLLTKFLPKVSLEEVMAFNLELNPFTSGSLGMKKTQKNIELMLSFLRMNQKLLGKAFALEGIMNQLLEEKRVLEEVEIKVDRRPLDEIRRRLILASNTPVEDTAVLKVFHELSHNDEPNKDSWGEVVTVERIKAYLHWLNDKKWEKKFKQYKKVEVLENHLGLFPHELITEALEEVDSLESRARGHLGQSLKILTVGELRGMAELVAESDPSMAENLNFLSSRLAYVQSKIALSPEEMHGIPIDSATRLTPEYSWEKLNGTLELAYKSFDLLLPVPLFDCDLKSIRDELHALTQYHKSKHKEGDYEYYHSWPKHVSLALVVEGLMDERNYGQEFLDILRGFDSVHTHQLANQLEDALRTYVQLTPEQLHYRSRHLIDYEEHSTEGKATRFSRLKKALATLCPPDVMAAMEAELNAGGSLQFDAVMKRLQLPPGQELLSLWKALHKNTVAPLAQEVRQIWEAQLALLKQYPEEADVWRRYIENIQWRSRFEVEGANEEIQRFRQSELWRNMLPLIERGIALAKQNQLVDDFSKDNRPSHLERIQGGDFKLLEEAVAARYAFKVRELLGYAYNDEECASIYNSLSSAMGLFLVGRQILHSGQKPVHFNETGDIQLPKMFNLYRPLERQIPHTVNYRFNHPGQLYASPNMSGKTYFNKGLLTSLGWSVATGHAFGAETSIPLLGQLIYLDRPSTPEEYDLSAYTQEMTHIVACLDAITPDKLTFVVIDELGSSTSPVYQSALTAGVGAEIIHRGATLVMSSHSPEGNEALLKTCEDHMQTWHFGFNVEKTPDGESRIHFDHTHRSGLAPSHGVLVSQTLGLSTKIQEYIF